MKLVMSNGKELDSKNAVAGIKAGWSKLSSFTKSHTANVHVPESVARGWNKASAAVVNIVPASAKDGFNNLSTVQKTIAITAFTAAVVVSGTLGAMSHKK